MERLRRKRLRNSLSFLYYLQNERNLELPPEKVLTYQTLQSNRILLSLVTNESYTSFISYPFNFVCKPSSYTINI